MAVSSAPHNACQIIIGNLSTHPRPPYCTTTQPTPSANTFFVAGLRRRRQTLKSIPRDTGADFLLSLTPHVIVEPAEIPALVMARMSTEANCRALLWHICGHFAARPGDAVPVEYPEGVVENGAATGAPSAKLIPFVLEFVNEDNTARPGIRPPNHSTL